MDGIDMGGIHCLAHTSLSCAGTQALTHRLLARAGMHALTYRTHARARAGTHALTLAAAFVAQQSRPGRSLGDNMELGDGIVGAALHRDRPTDQPTNQPTRQAGVARDQKGADTVVDK